MAKVINIERAKLKEFKQYRELKREMNLKLDEILVSQKRFFMENPHLCQLDLLIMRSVFSIDRKRVCNDCLTQEELLKILRNHENRGLQSEPRKIQKPKLLKCSRCGEECN